MKPIQRYRSTLTRTAAASAIGLLMLAPGLSQATPAAPDLGTTRTGLIVTSDVFLREAPYDSALTFAEAMNRLSPAGSIGAYCSGSWRVHFAAQIEQPLGEETLDLRFYDLSTLGRPGQRIRVLSSSIPVHPGDTTIFVNDFVISKDLGFVSGHKYEVSLWRRAAPERTALAKGTFGLK